MITAHFDRAKGEKSLKAFAKSFGETSAQGVVRWSVQVCRELAFESQVYGKKGARKKQEGAIRKDMFNKLFINDVAKGKSVLTSPAAVIDFLGTSYKSRHRRQRKFKPEEKKTCSKAIFEKVVRMKLVNAGIPKGGWLGAGIKIAEAQTGQDKITIGRSYLGYAQKHLYFGSAKKPAKHFSPVAKVTNLSDHSGDPWVLKPAQIKKALNFGLSKTLKWYQKTMAANDKKKTA